MNQDPKLLTKSTLANAESGEKRTQLPALNSNDQNGYISDFYKNKAARESDKNQYTSDGSAKIAANI